MHNAFWHLPKGSLISSMNVDNSFYMDIYCMSEYRPIGYYMCITVKKLFAFITV